MSKSLIKSTPIFLAFLCMGFGDVAGPLTSQIQNEYDLSNIMAGLVTFMGFIMFGILSVPLGIYQDRKGKKFVLQMGLIFALVGLLLPIIGNFSSFALLLGSLLLLGTGATALQVAGNPVMRDVSPEGKYSRNLSFGQFIKAIGTLAGALIPLAAANYYGKDWKILFPIYAIAVLATIIYVTSINIEEKRDEQSKSVASFSSCLRLLRNPYILMMVLGIFFYVGAEVSIGAKLPNYLEHKFDFDIKRLGLVGTLFFFISIMTGRLVGSIILNWMSPKKFLMITSILSLMGIAGLFFASNEWLGFFFITLIGLGFANIFPLIFSITIDNMPERSNEISGLMVTAIIGGAFVPLLFGLVADMFSLMAGFVVPVLCLTYILIIAFRKTKKTVQ